MSASSDRIVDLEIARVTEGLGLGARTELDSLIGRHGEGGRETFELAAAAVDLAALEIEPLPEAVRGRLLEHASQFVADESTWPRPVDTGFVATRSRSANDRQRSATDQAMIGQAAGRERSRSTAPWLLAAAALVAAVLGWVRPGVDDVEIPIDRPPQVASLEDQRARLLEASEALVIDWATTEDEAAEGVEGDVVWDNERQRGYMRFRGLPANDPETLQYQLWIFDGTRDERHPVDGGVFDVVGDEVVVPIEAKLAVREPTLFAVTIEPPGGVVVSSRERIVTLAQVG